jgi:putative endonuclease
MTAYVYILSNKRHTVFYIGVTRSLVGRIPQHKNKKYPRSFTSKYNIDKLIYFETYETMHEAIKREKQLKKKARVYKLDLINKQNPRWQDLFNNKDELKFR